MRNLFISLLAVSLVFSACKNDKKVTVKDKNEDGTTTTTTVDMNNAADNTDEMNRKMEELKKLTPLTLDQLKALLPEELNGIKRKEFNTSSALGYTFGQAKYEKDDTTQIELTVYDCAGEAGAGIYGLNYWTKMNMQSESSNGYTKTIDFNGTKAVESFEKGSNQYTLTYTANERLLLVLTGRNISVDELKNAAKNLNLKV
jgi:hypothetical protein